MCFFNYTAEQVAPCLGLLEDGTTEKTPESIDAARKFFDNNQGLLVDGSLWERNDAKYKRLVDENIRRALGEQKKRRLVAKERV